MWEIWSYYRLILCVGRLQIDDAHYGYQSLVAHNDDEMTKDILHPKHNMVCSDMEKNDCIVNFPTHWYATTNTTILLILLLSYY